MAILKMGSKGKDVEALQKRLNDLKSVDGDFGKNTQKSVIYFQKKIAGFDGKGVDGTVGEWTQSALDYGKAMPKPPRIDPDAKAANYAKQQQYNAKFTALLSQIEGSLNKFSKDIGVQVEKARSMVVKNNPEWESLIKSTTELEKKIQQFETTVKKNPGAAEKLAKEAEALDAKRKSHLEKITKSTGAMEKEMDAISNTLDAGSANLKKSIASYKKF